MKCVCGVEFAPKPYWQKYCSKRCRGREQMRAYRAKLRLHKTAQPEAGTDPITKP